MEQKANNCPPISILIVEDDEISLQLQSSVVAAKFPVVMIYTAINGTHGLELFKAHTPNIVITDINMQVMCGVQLAENIRANKPETRIIAITGRSGELGENRKFILSNSEGKVIEFDYVIVKPVDLFELFGVIEQYIGEVQQRMS